MTIRRIALLTSGGFAPCLSTAVGGLIDRYSEVAPEVEIIAYEYGYLGLLSGNYFTVNESVRKNARVLFDYGGSPLGKSRIQLTNAKDLIRRGIINESQDPLQIAAERLQADKVDVLHTIGGDDTNTTAADLASYLNDNSYQLTVVGLPKTIDNDIMPIRQSLGAWTAAEETARFTRNIFSEGRSEPRTLLVHEIMGRNCGWLTAASAYEYRKWLDTCQWVEELGLDRKYWDIHGIFIPELQLNIHDEIERLRKIMDEQGNVNLFISEGAGINEIIAERKASGQEIKRDPFGHVLLDKVNSGQYFAEQFAVGLGAKRVLVQKSGYFARSAPSNKADLHLIKSMVDLAVQAAFLHQSGVVGHDEDDADKLKVIDFSRIKGGKPFNVEQPWFIDMLQEIGQTIQRD